MPAVDDLAEALRVVTPQEWFDLARADEEGPLPPCCAEVSDLRDELLALLRAPSPTRAMVVARTALNGTHDHSRPVTRLVAALIRVLDVVRPSWRTDDLPTPERLTLFDARVNLWRELGPDSPTWAPAPREAWDGLLARALQLMAMAPAREGDHPEQAVFEQHDRTRVLLGEALAAGGPPGVLLALFHASQGLYVDAVDTIRAARS